VKAPIAATSATPMFARFRNSFIFWNSAGGRQDAQRGTE